MEVVAIVSVISGIHGLPPVLQYVGPDVFLPLTSALAAILGVLLLFWHKMVGLATAAWRVIMRRPKPLEDAKPSIMHDDDRP